MPPSFRSIISTIGIWVIIFSLLQCDDSSPKHDWNGEVEIAPGEWLAIEEKRGRAWFRCQWRGKEVFWPGEYAWSQSGYYDRHIPVTLRSWQGRLFLIYKYTEEGEDGLITFGYAMLDDSGTRFKSIPPEQFPRQIATANYSPHAEGQAHDKDDQPYDMLEVSRQMDPKHPAFAGTLTARIWYHLERGLRWQEIIDTPEEAEAFLTFFIAKHQPIRLPTLVR